MKYSELFEDSDRYNPGQSDDDILYEMSNFRSRVTGLPSNIEIWVRSDPINHGHNRYRVKILKDREWAAIYSVGSNPELLESISDKLTKSDDGSIKEFISEYSPLLIQLIDCKIDTGEFEYAVIKARGEK